MGLSPGENPVTYRDREIVRKLRPLREKAIRLGIACEHISEAIDLHTSQAEAAEARSFASSFTGSHVEVTDGRRIIGVDDVLRPF
jgi:hypothetical protein